MQLAAQVQTILEARLVVTQYLMASLRLAAVAAVAGVQIGSVDQVDQVVVPVQVALPQEQVVLEHLVKDLMEVVLQLI